MPTRKDLRKHALLPCLRDGIGRVNPLKEVLSTRSVVLGDEVWEVYNIPRVPFPAFWTASAGFIVADA